MEGSRGVRYQRYVSTFSFHPSSSIHLPAKNELTDGYWHFFLLWRQSLTKRIAAFSSVRNRFLCPHRHVNSAHVAMNSCPCSYPISSLHISRVPTSPAQCPHLVREDVTFDWIFTGRLKLHLLGHRGTGGAPSGSQQASRWSRQKPNPALLNNELLTPREVRNILAIRELFPPAPWLRPHCPQSRACVLGTCTGGSSNRFRSPREACRGALGPPAPAWKARPLPASLTPLAVIARPGAPPASSGERREVVGGKGDTSRRREARRRA